MPGLEEPCRASHQPLLASPRFLPRAHGALVLLLSSLGCDGFLSVCRRGTQRAELPRQRLLQPAASPALPSPPSCPESPSCCGRAAPRGLRSSCWPGSTRACRCEASETQRAWRKQQNTTWGRVVLPEAVTSRGLVSRWLWCWGTPAEQLEVQRVDRGGLQPLLPLSVLLRERCYGESQLNLIFPLLFPIFVFPMHCSSPPIHGHWFLQGALCSAGALGAARSARSPALYNI